MAGDLYFDTYKRYKAGTSKIITWLAETARKCGASGISQASKAPRTSKVTIALSDFTKLTRTIVNATEPAVDIPPNILDILKDVIASRRSCSEWFQKTSEDCGDTEQRGDGHTHFIAVLEDILEILETRSSSNSRSKSKCERRKASHTSSTVLSSDDDLGRLNNVFEHLTLEDSPNAPSTSEALEDTEQPERITRRTIYELEPSDNDIIFAIFCYFKDRDAVRAFIRQTWTSYRDGKIGLITASLTTNTAAEVVRRAEEELANSFPQLSSYDKIIIALLHKKPEDSIDLSWPTQEKANACIGTYLAAYMHRARAGLIPDPSSLPLAPKEALQDLPILARALTDIFILIADDGSLCIQDELHRGLCLMVRDKKILAWLLFACQVYMDIHTILGEDVSRAWDQLRLAGDRALQSVRGYFKFRPYSCYGDKVKEAEEAFAQLVLIITTHVKADLGAKARQKMRKKQEEPESDVPPFCLMTQHPVFCGLVLFRMNRTLQLHGTYLANLSGITTSCAHLYNAMIQSDLLAHRWADMDALISYHGEEIFVGGPPTEPKDFLKRYYLMEGLSIRAFSRERKLNGVWDEQRLPKSGKGRRGLINCTPVIGIFHDRFSGDAQKAAESGIPVRHVEALLEESRKHNRDDSSADERRTIAKIWNRSHRLSSTQLLSILQEGLAEDELHLNFDYLSMDQRCHELLLRVCSNINNAYPQLKLGNDAAGVSSLRDVVRLVFSSLCKADGEHNGWPVELTLFREAAVPLQEIIEREGDVEIKKARILSNM